jgi:hypothetical protein
MITIPVCSPLRWRCSSSSPFAGDPVTALLNPEQMANMGPEWVEAQRESLA